MIIGLTQSVERPSIDECETAGGNSIDNTAGGGEGARCLAQIHSSKLISILRGKGNVASSEWNEWISHHHGRHTDFDYDIDGLE